MDIIAHGAWSFLTAKAVNARRTERPLNPWYTGLWGIFPDLASFGIVFAYGIVTLILGDRSFLAFMHRAPDALEPISAAAFPLASIVPLLYSFTHSIVVFFAIFFLVLLIRRKPCWELLGWALHIMIDVPTHSYAFYPTPVFWPLSDWKFDGISWGTTWFMIGNYVALAISFFALHASRMVKIRRTPNTHA